MREASGDPAIRPESADLAPPAGSLPSSASSPEVDLTLLPVSRADEHDGGPEALRLPPVDVREEDLDGGAAVQALLDDFRRWRSEPLADDLASIEQAFGLAAHAHAQQRRKSGEPYLVHPVRVARTLAQLGLDAVSVVAGLLHDAVEDSEMTVFDVHERFGREVASIVDGVTKLGKVPYLSRQEQQAESFRKMLLAMSDDIRVLIVKLSDRLDNMRTLDHVSAEKQERVSRETMQIYAPLAGRLGIEWLRRELQDLGFRYLEPTLYQATRQDIDEFLMRRPGIIDGALEQLRNAFDPSVRPGSVDEDDEVADAPASWPEALGQVRVRVTMRPPFRVHRRLEAAGRKPDQISDVATFQVVVGDRTTCYAALGQLHAHFQPVPGRFRDYIALPRPNHYRALHTSVIDKSGQRIEVQIRSERMDAVAERGIIVEWQGTGPRRESLRLQWLGQLMDWQEEVSDPHEFIEAVKADLFADEVYVFSPQGDILTFPKSATPIDFAFAIHTDVGMHCSGARVNGHLVPLRYRLRQGDTVEILTNPSVGPREEWLKMCVSSRARAKIKQYLRQRERQRLRTLGRSLVEQEVASRGVDLATFEARGTVAEQAEPLGLGKDARGDDGVYEAVGAGQITAEAVADKLGASEPGADKSLLSRVLRRMTRPGVRDRDALGPRPGASPIVITRDLVEGKPGKDPMVALATCCSPVPGDPIIGFFEPGKGIVAHVEGCTQALEQLSERRVPLTWEENLALCCPVTIEVKTANTVGLLAEMSRAFSQNDVNIKQANCRSYGDGDRAINTFAATVQNLAQLQGLVQTLKAINGVVAVERVFTSGTGGTSPYP